MSDPACLRGVFFGSYFGGVPCTSLLQVNGTEHWEQMLEVEFGGMNDVRRLGPVICVVHFGCSPARAQLPVAVLISHVVKINM